MIKRRKKVFMLAGKIRQGQIFSVLLNISDYLKTNIELLSTSDSIPSSN